MTTKYWQVVVVSEDGIEEVTKPNSDLIASTVSCDLLNRYYDTDRFRVIEVDQ